MRTSVLHLSSKSQTTIPAWVRDALKVKPNMDIEIIELTPGNLSLVARPTTKDPIEALCGILKGKGLDHVDMVQSLIEDKEEDIRLEERGLK